MQGMYALAALAALASAVVVLTLALILVCAPLAVAGAAGAAAGDGVAVETVVPCTNTSATRHTAPACRPLLPAACSLVAASQR